MIEEYSSDSFMDGYHAGYDESWDEARDKGFDEGYETGRDRAFDEVLEMVDRTGFVVTPCLLYTSPSPRDRTRSRMPSSA